eukprot:CAMPEP_0184345850 /NCGR_PEP_ID=MMETSP1089-20130417/14198_1 /TAXON_ID=38269 ORGANISM="Gloeochaete wittrockiana, Strain SAG46.84" /NCGR_SAMPLE_ID=MMETSP1089 /ASSEMBLY_ACC=CAM_ASM_000445 /LENGTH=396 /DNA_ID=CAMNT_0026676307 /DNA_START=43 /DNA_END=1233 /DNA_ORIENTATION=+
MTLGLKFIFNQDIRRVSLHNEELSLQKLRNVAVQLFGSALPESFVFQYTDSDGDAITIASDIELEEALKFSSSPSGLLRLTIVEFVQKNPSSSSSSSSASSAASLYPSAFSSSPALSAQPSPSSSSSSSLLVSPSESQEGHAEDENTVMKEESVSYPQLESAFVPPTTCTDTFDVAEIKTAISQIADEAVRDAQSFFDRIVSGIRSFINPDDAHQARPITNDPVFGVAASAGALGGVKDVTLTDGSEVPPSSGLIKIWKLKNSSSVEWPAHSVLRHTAGPSLGFAQNIFLETTVKPGAEIEISTRLVSPAESGRFVAHFRLQTPSGSFVGPRLWVDIKVVEFLPAEDVFASSLEDIKDNLKTLEMMGFDRDLSIRALIASKNNIDAAIHSFFMDAQ